MGIRSWFKENLRDKSLDLPENWGSLDGAQKKEAILKEYMTRSLDDTYNETGGGAEYGPWQELKTKYGKDPAFEDALYDWLYEKARGNSTSYYGPSDEELKNEQTLMNSVLGW